MVTPILHDMHLQEKKSMNFRHFRPVQVTLFVVTFLLGVAQASAQDFKIYTPVFDLKAEEGTARAGQKPQRPIVARSVTYFHAGQAFDYIETEGEVLVYEPAAHRFTILHAERGMLTTITFEELNKMVKDAEINAQTHVLRSREEKLDNEARLNMIEFQIHPQFREVFNRSKNSLSLNSPLMSYHVKGVTMESPERLLAYLKYCDWMAKLNFVLHPHAPLPSPRLTLNESLRKQNLMPVEVTLKANIGPGIELRAEHQIQWQLGPKDRERIHVWQTLMSQEDIRHVPFSQFREVQLADR